MATKSAASEPEEFPDSPMGEPPAEEEKRGRGRPPGSKTKAKKAGGAPEGMSAQERIFLKLVGEAPLRAASEIAAQGFRKRLVFDEPLVDAVGEAFVEWAATWKFKPKPWHLYIGAVAFAVSRAKVENLPAPKNGAPHGQPERPLDGGGNRPASPQPA